MIFLRINSQISLFIWGNSFPPKNIWGTAFPAFPLDYTTGHRDYISRRITEHIRVTTFLFQLLSVALQRRIIRTA